MNWKQLLKLKAAGAGKGGGAIEFGYMLSAFTNGSGSGTAKHVAISGGQGAYAGGFGTKATDNIVRNATEDGKTYYPILLKGASKLAFDVPADVKVTVFFVDSKTKADTYNAAKWIGGDSSAYDSSVDNGPREVTVPEGADAFTFSIYYKSHTVTDEIMQSVKITAS